jgi:hypothetical protein
LITTAPARSRADAEYDKAHNSLIMISDELYLLAG